MEKVPGFSDVNTDCAMKKCSFRVTDAELDVNAKLDELAESNEHIAGWSRL